jgi:hypothetical protein
MKVFALVAVLGIFAHWKVNNLRGISADLENKSTPATKTLNKTQDL